jgi:amidohydrolase
MPASSASTRTVGCGDVPSDPEECRVPLSPPDPAEQLIATRRELHRTPEIGLELPRTQALLLDALHGLHLDIRLGSRTSSITGVLHGAQPGPTVLLRADMDALPVEERSGLSFAADNGAMHACGHDLHCAMLVGAARILAQSRDAICGDITLMFQPGEEGHGGARIMLDEGVLDATGARPVAAYAVHVLSAGLAAGEYASRPGTLMAAADTMTVTVKGTGGHGSTPHRARDPIVVLAEIITALQAMVTRRFDIFDPVVLTVGRISGGTAHNVIPATATLEATLRTFTEKSRQTLVRSAADLCRGLAQAHGLDADVRVDAAFPLTVNNADEFRFASEVAMDLGDATAFTPLPKPIAGSEDFSLLLQQVPGAMVLIGACPSDQDPATAAFNHAPEARFDESVIADGATYLATVALRRLRAAVDGP